MKLFDQWRSAGVPAWLRVWLPNPFHVSHALLHAPPRGATRGLRAFFGAGMVVAGLSLVLGFLAAVLVMGGLAILGAGERVPLALFGVVALGGLLYVAIGAALTWGGSKLVGDDRPQVSRLAAVSVALPAALLPATAVAIDAWDSPAPAGVLALVAAFAFTVSLVASRPRAWLGRAVERASGYATLAGVFLTVLTVGCLVRSTLSVSDAGVVSSHVTPASWATVIVGFAGLGTLGLALFMAAVARAHLHPWRASETWLEGDLGEGRAITFAGGAASRQASETFAAYRGPVVVIPVGARQKGVFRGDGGPDDGWTVPGTLASVREAVASCDLAVNGAVLTVALVAAGLLVVAVMSAVASGFSGA